MSTFSASLLKVGIHFKLIEETSAEEKLSTAGSTSSGGESSGGGDTDILGEDENETMQDFSDSSV